MTHPEIIRRKETWVGDTITVHGVPHEVPREVAKALARAAEAKSMAMQEFIDFSTRHLNTDATIRTLRRVAAPFLPDDWKTRT